MTKSDFSGLFLNCLL